MKTIAAFFAAGAVALTLAAQPAARPDSLARPHFVDGQAQVVSGFQDEAQWIRETLWVETSFDSDRDGRPDRMFVGVTRQRQTETEGLKVPVIYESSPYFAGTSGDRKFLWDVKQEVGEPPPPRTSQPPIEFRPDRERVSNSLVAAWVPRGFAVVHSDAPGTGLSQGCPTIGGDPEQLAPKAVIDWLNGRARGFRTIDGAEDEEVLATWSTGKVGMTGTSYNGTIPLAAAVTGVRGLEAIIPIAPNTSYYHYYRSNGLVRHPGGWLGEDIDFLYDFVNSGDPARREQCNALYRDGEFARGRDRESGDYNEFWRSRDLLPKVRNIRAAVLMAHAFNDWNVVPEHSVRIYDALKGRVPRQAYFHQGGHGGAPPLEMMNRWFTRYLYGVENGVERMPKAWIVRETAVAELRRSRGRRATGPAANSAADPYPDYPHPSARDVTLASRRRHARGRAVAGPAARPGA
jgi:X-Pro dipeptidyl-peptidase